MATQHQRSGLPTSQTTDVMCTDLHTCNPQDNATPRIDLPTTDFTTPTGRRVGVLSVAAGWLGMPLGSRVFGILLCSYCPQNYRLFPPHINLTYPKSGIQSSPEAELAEPPPHTLHTTIRRPSRRRCSEAIFGVSRPSVGVDCAGDKSSCSERARCPVCGR